MTTEVRVPTLGESVTEATVATWFKKPGEVIAVDEMLCELETDKVTVEVPSPVAGTLADFVSRVLAARERQLRHFGRGQALADGTRQWPTPGRLGQAAQQILARQAHRKARHASGHITGQTPGRLALINRAYGPSRRV